MISEEERIALSGVRVYIYKGTLSEKEMREMERPRMGKIIPFDRMPEVIYPTVGIAKLERIIGGEEWRS